MRLRCPTCAAVQEFAERRPAFCSACGSALPATDPAETTADLHPAPSDGAPELVGGYRLLRQLGEGGMGAVYEAENDTGRRVAVKLINPEYAESPEALARFRLEGRLSSILSHPRCVFVLAADEDDGRPYIVMELMPGETLDDLVTRTGPLPVEEAVAKMLDVLEGLEEAHHRGIVHRDVKPSNCFLDRDGRVKVGDFGLSKSLMRDANLSRPGAFLGTPLFASPEQVKGRPVDARSDLYSAAATLYFLLAGRAPFSGGDGAAALARILTESPTPLKQVRPDVPRELERVVMRGLRREPERRWRTAGAFRHALQPFVPGRLPAAPPSLRLGAFFIDAVLLAFLWFFTLVPVNDLILRPWLRPPEPQKTPGRELTPTERDEFDARERAWKNEVRWWTGARSAAVLLSLTATALLWFGVPEAVWGATVGKWWLRLRLYGGGADPPDVRPALTRALVFTSLAILPGTLALATGQWDRLLGVPNDVAAQMSVVGTAVGVVLLCLPMRRANGWRMLHDRLTGVRVLRLPRPAAPPLPRARFVVADPPEPAAVGVPATLGPFEVRRVLRWDDDRLLLAEDPSLERTVWLRLRPADEPGLPAVRRELARGGRLRWLASGVEPPYRWDAFAAPTGRPLNEVVVGQPLPWTQARPVVEQLSEELTAAVADGTLPPELGCGHVWLQPDGRALLLDVPLCPSPAEPATTDAHTEDDGRALGLLRQVALILLEGRPRPLASPPQRVAAPIALHASNLLERLFAVGNRFTTASELTAGLAATRDEPTEVSRSGRTAQLMALTALLALALVAHAFGAVIAAYLYALYAEFVLGKKIDGCAMIIVYIVFITISLALVPPVWVIGALVFRGGFSLGLVGLALVRRDGRPAARWQCFVRSLVFWLPLSLPWCVMGKFDLGYWGGWTSFALLAAYVGVALATPSRSLNDRLAGTWVVPK